MLLEKCEHVLELSFKQLVVQSSLASSIFQSQIMCGVCKTKITMLFVQSWVFFISNKSYPSPI